MPRIKASVGVTEQVILKSFEAPYEELTVVCKTQSSLALFLLFLVEAETIQQRAERFQRFGKEVLLSWNLDDDDEQPIPANAQGMIDIPPGLAWDIVNAWFTERTEVPVPLVQESSDGSISS